MTEAQMPTPDTWVTALARERAMFAGGERKDMVIAVDEQLAALGWCVHAETGELVPVPTEVVAPKTRARKERAVPDPVIEKAVED